MKVMIFGNEIQEQSHEVTKEFYAENSINYYQSSFQNIPNRTNNLLRQSKKPRPIPVPPVPIEFQLSTNYTTFLQSNFSVENFSENVSQVAPGGRRAAEERLTRSEECLLGSKSLSIFNPKESTQQAQVITKTIESHQTSSIDNLTASNKKVKELQKDQTKMEQTKKGTFFKTKKKGPSGKVSSDSTNSLAGSQCSIASTLAPPKDLSIEESTPGLLKIFGGKIKPGALYKSVLAHERSTARELVKEALDRYGLPKRSCGQYVLCDVIGLLEPNQNETDEREDEEHNKNRYGNNHSSVEIIDDCKWIEKGIRVVGEQEMPLAHQLLWKPSKGLTRRLELRRRDDIEQKFSSIKDISTKLMNRNVRRIQITRAKLNRITEESKDEEDSPESPGDEEDTNQQHMQKSRASFRSQHGSSTNSSSRGKQVPQESSGSSIKLASPGATEEEGSMGSGEGHQMLGGDACSADTTSGGSTTVENSKKCIAPPTDCPFILMLRGYNPGHDSLVYILTDQITIIGCTEYGTSNMNVNEKTEIVLSCPDIKQQHCWILKKTKAMDRVSGSGQRLNNLSESLIVKIHPIPGAMIQVNGSPVTKPTELKSGDILCLGQHYIFLYKDLTTFKEIPREAPWLKALARKQDMETGTLLNMKLNELDQSLPTCDDHSNLRYQSNVNEAFMYEDENGRILPVLVYEKNQEQDLVEFILTSTDANGDGFKLAPCYLLSVVLDHSIEAFGAWETKILIYKIIIEVNEKAREVCDILSGYDFESAAVNSNARSYSLVLTLGQLLRPVAFWMANALELLNGLESRKAIFARASMEGPRENRKIVSPEERAMIEASGDQILAMLEDIVLLLFQETVYQITKVLTFTLPNLLNANPFQHTVDSPNNRMPLGIQTVLDVFKCIVDTFSRQLVHSAVTEHLFACLLFFTNAFLFNQLMDRGSNGNYFKWTKGAQIRGNLDALESWLYQHSLQYVANECLAQLSAAVDLLAMLKMQLLQADWEKLRNTFPQLSPAQLFYILSHYNLENKSFPQSWVPMAEERALAEGEQYYENMDGAPPLDFPTQGFVVGANMEVPDESIYEHIAAIAKKFPVKNGNLRKKLSSNSRNTPSAIDSFWQKRRKHQANIVKIFTQAEGTLPLDMQAKREKQIGQTKAKNFTESEVTHTSYQQQNLARQNQQKSNFNVPQISRYTHASTNNVISSCTNQSQAFKPPDLPERKLNQTNSSLHPQVVTENTSGLVGRTQNNLNTMQEPSSSNDKLSVIHPTQSAHQIQPQVKQQKQVRRHFESPGFSHESLPLNSSVNHQQIDNRQNSSSENIADNRQRKGLYEDVGNHWMQPPIPETLKDRISMPQYPNSSSNKGLNQPTYSTKQKPITLPVKTKSTEFQSDVKIARKPPPPLPKPQLAPNMKQQSDVKKTNIMLTSELIPEKPVISSYVAAISQSAHARLFPQKGIHQEKVGNEDLRGAGHSPQQLKNGTCAQAKEHLEDTTSVRSSLEQHNSRSDPPTNQQTSIRMTRSNRREQEQNKQVPVVNGTRETDHNELSPTFRSSSASAFIKLQQTGKKFVPAIISTQDSQTKQVTMSGNVQSHKEHHLPTSDYRESRRSEQQHPPKFKAIDPEALSICSTTMTEDREIAQLMENPPEYFTDDEYSNSIYSEEDTNTIYEDDYTRVDDELSDGGTTKNELSMRYQDDDSDTEEFLFVVELERPRYTTGAPGLGVGLVDGLATALGKPGVYVRTVAPDSPAAVDGRLRVGDRIMGVNGVSIACADYSEAMVRIKQAGDKVQFLVAKCPGDGSENGKLLSIKSH